MKINTNCMQMDVNIYTSSGEEKNDTQNEA